jgi:D-alanine-D-alanine ligase-like ATP-grasp enzyme/methylase of polypeptide subunit release factors
MRIGIVRTVGSPCRCAEALSRGLESLGHEYWIADSEEIALWASELARRCDLVIDHTDTFHGQGLFRPLIRHLLETQGSRMVGSDAKACFLADDKMTSKTRLAEAGIPVPPGIVVRSKNWQLPQWLPPPLVLKPAYEHMSRGLCLAVTDAEAHAKASDLLESLHQPILVEKYISGRELAVSLLEGPGGLEVLPPLEWRVDGSGTEILSEAFKRIEPVGEGIGERKEALRADLPVDLEKDLESLVLRAFQVLGLRDYARFDIRLSLGGTFFFLEANTTPSLEPLEALALSARWAGMDYPALVRRMLSAALKRLKDRPVVKEKQMVIDLPSGPLDLTVPEGVHAPPQSSIELARILDAKTGEEVLELGCGAGLLSIAAAKLGARSVMATDIDPLALQTTLLNARRNGMEDRIRARAGSWYDALENGVCGPFDVILATPPQTPGPRPFGPRYGGPDGTKHLFTVVDGASAFLKPGGRLWLLAITLANPSALLKRLGEKFASVSIVRQTERPFTAEEYDSMEEGLFSHFQTLFASGCSGFREAGPGKYLFMNLFIRAEGRHST